MTKIDSDRRIINLARKLRLNGQGSITDQIIDYCSNMISEWVRDEDVSTITRLEEIVCEKLNLEFEEIWEDEDIDRLVRKYVALGDFAFAGLTTNFDGETFGTTFKRLKSSPQEPDRYVAFIDCRGAKGQRRFFTRWHEIAHLLTLPPEDGQSVNRSSIARCPVEQLMDKIAGVIGFFDPIFHPALSGYLGRAGILTFSEVEAVRNRFCPIASFQATLIACVRRVSQPAVYLEAGMGYKKDELEKIASQQMRMFAEDEPEARLRVYTANANDAAREMRVRFDRNMEVPEQSVVFRSFDNQTMRGSATDLEGTENLSIWKHSDGSVLGSMDIEIEARRLKDRVFALVRPSTVGGARARPSEPLTSTA